MLHMSAWQHRVPNLLRVKLRWMGYVNPSRGIVRYTHTPEKNPSLSAELLTMGWAGRERLWGSAITRRSISSFWQCIGQGGTTQNEKHQIRLGRDGVVRQHNAWCVKRCPRIYKHGIRASQLLQGHQNLHQIWVRRSLKVLACISTSISFDRYLQHFEGVTNDVYDCCQDEPTLLRLQR